MYELYTCYDLFVTYKYCEKYNDIRVLNFLCFFGQIGILDEILDKTSTDYSFNKNIKCTKSPK